MLKKLLSLIALALSFSAFAMISDTVPTVKKIIADNPKASPAILDAFDPKSAAMCMSVAITAGAIQLKSKALQNDDQYDVIYSWMLVSTGIAKDAYIKQGILTQAKFDQWLAVFGNDPSMKPTPSRSILDECQNRTGKVLGAIYKKN